MSQQQNSPSSSVLDNPLEALQSHLPYRVEPTNIPGVYAVVAPPAGFDPLTASQEELLRYGIPFRRPAEKDDPETWAAFERFCKRHWSKLKVINPAMDSQPSRQRSYRVPRKEASQSAGQSAGPDTTGSTWAGTVYQMGALWQGDWQNPQVKTYGSYTSVMGSWRVPAVSIPNNAQLAQFDVSIAQQSNGVYEYDFSATNPIFPEVSSEPGGPWESATWIGLGGFVPEYNNNGSAAGQDDILQVGIIQEISAAGVANYQAFWEWYTPGNPASSTMHRIANTINHRLGRQTIFAVHPGDMISASITHQPGVTTAAQVSLHNATTGEAFSFAIPAPANSVWVAASAEWIMEATGNASQSTPNIANFPFFTPINYTCPYATASTADTGQNISAMPALTENIATIDGNGCLNPNATTTEVNFTTPIELFETPTITIAWPTEAS